LVFSLISEKDLGVLQSRTHVGHFIGSHREVESRHFPD